MLHSAALPFVVTRKHDVVGVIEATTTSERMHGLLRLEGEQLVIQWRTSREVQRTGIASSRTDRELAPLREAIIPLALIAGSRLKRIWHSWLPSEAVVLTAADMRAFSGLGDEADMPGLLLRHPAEIVLDVRRSDRMLAREFVSELNLAIADRELRLAEGESRLELPLNRDRS